MTVKELIKELRQYDGNLNVAVVTDWNCCTGVSSIKEYS